MSLTKSRNLNCVCSIGGVDIPFTIQIEPDMRVCPYCGWPTYTHAEWDIMFSSEFDGLCEVED